MSKPILFNGDMVRALLDGRKTQTRRVVKPQPVFQRDEKGVTWEQGQYIGGGQSEECWAAHALDRCPFGRPGDLLWVRETWHRHFAGDDDSEPNGVCYAATNKGPEPHRWRPSIHMPRWASRITLRITDVRVERLQDISDEDAIAEGVRPDPMFVGADDLMVGQLKMMLGVSAPIARYILLWDGINNRMPNNWNSNPWVWVIAFEVIRKNIDKVQL